MDGRAPLPPRPRNSTLWHYIETVDAFAASAGVATPMRDRAAELFEHCIDMGLGEHDVAIMVDGAQAKDMLAMTRQLFPHDKLGDEYYWVVVEAIDRDMAGSPELATRIRNGLTQLDQTAGGDFTALSPDAQIATMKKLENTPFFSDMLNKTQLYFYNNKAVWAKFGYEGSSWEQGGYINRGFNDVTWVGS